MEDQATEGTEESMGKLQNVALADGAVLAADPDQPVTPEELTSSIASSVIFLGVGIFLTICAFLMPNSELTGSPSKWYISPGLFPGFIGLGLIVMSVSLIAKTALKCRSAGHKLSLGHLKPRGGRTDLVRLLLAAALLALYVLSLGTLNFTAATFIYLSLSMIAFRTRGYSLPKILIYAAIFAVAVTYGFGTLARIPLP